MRILLAAALLIAATGCAELRQGNRTSSSTAATGVASRPDDVETIVDGWGRVRASADVLATFPQPLWAAQDANRTVEPCRRAVEAASAKDGPAIVQAAGRGPELRTRRGLYEGAVEVRIIYALEGVHIIRQVTLRCITRADGTFVDARPLEAETS